MGELYMTQSIISLYFLLNVPIVNFNLNLRKFNYTSYIILSFVTNHRETCAILELTFTQFLQVQSFLHSNLDGIILETYGAGNFPSNRTDILYELKKASARGVFIINCSQCCVGYVTNDYECGKVIHRCLFFIFVRINSFLYIFKI